MRKALDNLKEVLESAGSSLDRVLSVRCWVSDWANWETMNASYVTYFTRDPKPVRAVAVSQCGQPAASGGSVEAGDTVGRRDERQGRLLRVGRQQRRRQQGIAQHDAAVIATVTPRVLAGTNPGGPQSAWVRAFYIDKTVDRAEFPHYKPEDYVYIPSKLAYGVSITDPCLGWEPTVEALGMLSEAVRRRRA